MLLQLSAGGRGCLYHESYQLLATVWVAGATAGDTVPERWPAWLPMTRIQWFPAWLEDEQLDWDLLRQLRLSHPTAEQVAVDRVTVLREGVVLQER
jgi:hypothetical protein